MYVLNVMCVKKKITGMYEFNQTHAEISFLIIDLKYYNSEV